MKKIIFTGGGSAGHVIVNVALIPELQKRKWSVEYIGSKTGIEKNIIGQLDHVSYSGISTGKLRRYFDWNNFKDPFKVVKGVFEAYSLIKKSKPDIIFSKGGFVSVPVIIGGWLNKVPVIIHESDMTPGLANKIAMPFATKILVTFSETLNYIKSNNGVHIGAIIRQEILSGNREKGLALCDFHKNKPVILVMGGSLGARKINEMVRENLTELLTQFQIVHICGKGQINEQYKMQGYKQFEYINEEISDIFAITDFVISRAGSNSIYEFLALQKPMLLIPLSKLASRGDQIANASSFEKAGYSYVLQEEELSVESFKKAIIDLVENKDFFINNMKNSKSVSNIGTVIQLIEEEAKKRK